MGTVDALSNNTIYSNHCITILRQAIEFQSSNMGCIQIIAVELLGLLSNVDS